MPQETRCPEICPEMCPEVARVRDHLSMVLDTAPVGVWMQDGKGKLSFVNRAFCEAMGIPEAEFLAVERYDMLLPQEYVPMCLASDAKALASDAPTVTIQQLPMADGQIHDLEVYKAVRRDASGEPVALVGVAVEATARLADAQSMRRARETAESLSRVKSEFLQTMSHEMLTPLNGIIGLAQALEDDVSPDRRSMVGDIRACGERLTRVIRAILDYAQLEARTTEASLVTFNPATEIVLLLGKVEHAVALSCDIGSEFDRDMVGDAEVLGKVLTALLRNALDFTLEGCISLTAQVATETPEGIEASFIVEDTGAGIPASFMPYLFTPFRQADSGFTRRHGGIGLDLALSKRLAEHTGGSLAVESVEGRGTTARLTMRFARTGAE